jgi:hypothetical protein
MNTATEHTTYTRPRVSLEPPAIGLTVGEAERFDELVLARIQERGGLAADARRDLVREVLAAGLVVVAGATGLEANRRYSHELAAMLAEDERFSPEERVELSRLALALAASLAIIQRKDRELEELRARGA